MLPKPPLLGGISFSQVVRDRDRNLLRVTLSADQKPLQLDCLGLPTQLLGLRQVCFGLVEGARPPRGPRRQELTGAVPAPQEAAPQPAAQQPAAQQPGTEQRHEDRAARAAAARPCRLC